MEKYAIYARVSTALEAQNSSFEAQSQDLQNKVTAIYPDLKLYKIYGDHGISGTKEERPDFQQMINDAKEGYFKTIITKSISRFARSTKILLNTLDELQQAGVRVIFLEENIDTSKTSQKFLLTVLGALAEMESVNIAEHKRMAKEVRWASGKMAFPHCVPFGYKYTKEDGITIVEEEAKIIQLIFELYQKNKSSKWIAKQLNDKGIKSPSGKLWQQNTVRTILNQKKYVGIFEETDSQTGEVHTFECPAIIKTEVFNYVQTRFRAHKPYGKRRLYSFSHISYCSCGCELTRAVKHLKLQVLDDPGTGGALWGCKSFSYELDTPCEHRFMIGETYLYEMVIEALIQNAHEKSEFGKHKIWHQLKEHIEQNDGGNFAKEMKIYEDKKKELTKKKSKLKDLYLKEIMTLDEVERENKRIDKQLRELKQPTPPEAKILNTIQLGKFVEAIHNDDLDVCRKAMFELFKDQEIKHAITEAFLEKIEYQTTQFDAKITLKDGSSYILHVPKRTPLKINPVWPQIVNTEKKLI